MIININLHYKLLEVDILNEINIYSRTTLMQLNIRILLGDEALNMIYISNDNRIYNSEVFF